MNEIKMCSQCYYCNENCPVNRLADYTPKKALSGIVLDCDYYKDRNDWKEHLKEGY